MPVDLMLNALITAHGRVVEHGVHSRERETLSIPGHSHSMNRFPRATA